MKHSHVGQSLSSILSDQYSNISKIFKLKSLLNDYPLKAIGNIDETDTSLLEHASEMKL